VFYFKNKKKLSKETNTLTIIGHRIKRCMFSNRLELEFDHVNILCKIEKINY